MAVDINFTPIGDIIDETITIIPSLVELIVGIAPLKIVQAVVAGVTGMIIGVADMAK